VRARVLRELVGSHVIANPAEGVVEAFLA
jgi:microcompartment protein CcmL/EutN